jgi:hypothetical protein
MHTGNASHLAITGGFIRLCAILFVVLFTVHFHADAQGVNSPMPHSSTLRPQLQTVVSDACSRFKQRIKKQLRRLVAL